MYLEETIIGEENLEVLHNDCAYDTGDKSFLNLIRKSDKVEIWYPTNNERNEVGYDFTEFRFFDTTKSDEPFEVKKMPCP